MEEPVAEDLVEEEDPAILGRQHHTLIIQIPMVTGKQELTQTITQTLVVVMAPTVLMAILEMHIPTAGSMVRKDPSNTLSSTMPG
jgi:hypothetical protein